MVAQQDDLERNLSFNHGNGASNRHKLLRQETQRIVTISTLGLAAASQDGDVDEVATVMIQRFFRSKWTSLRNVHKSNLALTRSRYRIRGRRNAEQEFKDKQDGEYWEQGDIAMHDKDVWEKRMLLRKHPAVTEQLKRWCGAVPIPLPFDHYMRLMVRIYKAMLPDFDTEDALFTAEEDWQDDVNSAVELYGVTDMGTSTRLPAAALMDSLFQLADYWTATVSPLTYAELLIRLFKGVVLCNAEGKRSGSLEAWQIGPGGVLIGSDGKPILGKDGLPLVSDPWIRAEGVVIDSNRNIVRGPDRRAIRIDPCVAPGDVIYDLKGRPVRGPDGQKLRGDINMSTGLLVFENDQPVLDKRDGKPLLVDCAVAIPAGGSIGPGGVIIDADGNLVLGADGQSMVIDPRIPVGGSIAPGGYILDAAGNRMLGADGKFLIVGKESQGQLKELDDIKYIDFEEELTQFAAKLEERRYNLAREKKEARRRAALPKITVHMKNSLPLQIARENQHPEQTVRWDDRPPDAPAFQPWRHQPGPAPAQALAKQSQVAWEFVFRRPKSDKNGEGASSSRSYTTRIHCMPDLSSPARNPPSPRAFGHTASSGFKLTQLKELSEPLQQMRRGDVHAYGRVSRLHSLAPPERAASSRLPPPSPQRGLYRVADATVMGALEARDVMQHAMSDRVVEARYPARAATAPERKLGQGRAHSSRAVTPVAQAPSSARVITSRAKLSDTAPLPQPAPRLTNWLKYQSPAELLGVSSSVLSARTAAGMGSTW